MEGVESLRGLISPYILQTEAQMFIDSWQFMSEVLWRAIGNGNVDLSRLSVERKTTEDIEHKENTLRTQRSSEPKGNLYPTGA